MNRSMKIFLGSIAALVVAGYVIPTVFLSSGVDEYSGEEKRYAQRALDDVELHLSSPSLYKLYTTKMIVYSMTATRDAECPYSVIVKLHTFFGFQYNSLDVSPDCFAKDS